MKPITQYVPGAADVYLPTRLFCGFWFRPNLVLVSGAFVAIETSGGRTPALAQLSDWIGQRRQGGDLDLARHRHVRSFR